MEIPMFEEPDSERPSSISHMPPPQAIFHPSPSPLPRPPSPSPTSLPLPSPPSSATPSPSSSSNTTAAATPTTTDNNPTSSTPIAHEEPTTSSRLERGCFPWSRLPSEGLDLLKALAPNPLVINKVVEGIGELHVVINYTCAQMLLGGGYKVELKLDNGVVNDFDYRIWYFIDTYLEEFDDAVAINAKIARRENRRFGAELVDAVADLLLDVLSTHWRRHYGRRLGRTTKNNQGSRQRQEVLTC
ncbi:hypothetical protein LTR10_017652 [Elasticomyces elasticus]|uniref:Uncharacterized protein n=1 Tax=Exophiala sideris TaxID=1016849 RepID=A0ABR0JP72_9EURO|nr:hypothetical protein LTR10_017652 [Elasticomyces elasticus]KAK5038297.1 hypothetical protein LTS07_001767 [Exophiala sideris]KAK5044281.1 hypothetical protein LTR13_000637 [Exophiala sideris]KAK5067781.1 hypothetical protein LTR69_001770 [Exophiala sideris]KAK5183979.1 hypothetical protein LTR44_003484 [Eurotiomycetes sp. CCFEE 6388]